jgi:hypothetical protein
MRVAFVEHYRAVAATILTPLFRVYLLADKLPDPVTANMVIDGIILFYAVTNTMSRPEYITFAY